MRVGGCSSRFEIREWPLHWRGPKKGTSFFFLYYQYLSCRHQNRNDIAVTIYSAKAKVHLNIKSLASLWGFWFRSVSISDFVLSLWFFQTWEFPFCQAGCNRALKGQSCMFWPIWVSFPFGVHSLAYIFMLVNHAPYRRSFDYRGYRAGRGILLNSLWLSNAMHIWSVRMAARYSKTKGQPFSICTLSK